MSNYQKPKYEVQVLDWNQFMPVEQQKWICATGCVTFDEAVKHLQVIQHSYEGVRIALADPNGWLPDEAGW